MSRTVPGGRWWSGGLLAWVAAVLVALQAPVRLPEGGASVDPPGALPAPAADAAPEDLDAFLAMRRWGVSLNEHREAAAAPAEPPGQEEPAVNPILAEMGYVGLIVERDRSAVLLASPEGEVARLAPGDTLPDGRILVSVTGNSLTLKVEGRPEEVLTLFPRVRE